jgi:hypothetical protein
MKTSGPCGQHRPKQQLPAEILGDLMGVIRRQFYPDATAKQWLQESNFIRREFVLYLAAWLDKRGVTLPPLRYKQILLERLNEIKQHGATDRIKYFPGYLKHVLQQHLKHHGEEYYQEGKNVRALAENALVAVGKIGTGGEHLDPIRVMAEARRDLLAARKKKAPRAARGQLDLL